MNVANIIEESRLGGPQIRIARVGGHMKNYGINTTVFMPKKNCKDFLKLCKKKRLKVELININNLDQNFLTIVKYLIYFFFDVKEIIYKLKKNKIDLIHVSGGSWQIKGIIAGRLAKIPTIWHLNDTNMPWIVLKIFKILSYLATGFIFSSQKSFQIYKTKYQKNFAIIPSAVNVNKFKKQNVKRLNLKKKIVVTVANISPVKNFECLVKSLKHTKVFFKDVHFLVVGATFSSQVSYKKKILDLVKKYNLKKNISFLGKKNNVKKYLDKAMIYLCTSDFESSPVSIWEAMSMELPIVSTNVGDLKKYIKDNYNGYLVEKNDYINISKKLSILINDKKKLIQFGKINRNLVVDNFSTDIISKKTFNFYKLILNEYF